VDGNVPGLSLLHRRDAHPSLPWSVVDFHRLFTLPKAFITRFAAGLAARCKRFRAGRWHHVTAIPRSQRPATLIYGRNLVFIREGKQDPEKAT
jgi:hypothetical protein